MVQHLPVPYHPQHHDGYCLAAYAKMVLAYWGKELLSLRQIANLLQIDPAFGASFRNITYLKSQKVRITLAEEDEDRLSFWLNQKTPLILAVEAGDLAYYAGEQFQHAIVLIGEDEAGYWVLDPYAGEKTRRVAYDELMLAWSGMGFLYAVIQPQLTK